MYNEGHSRTWMWERGKVASAIQATVARTDAANVAHATTPASRVRRVGIVYETTVGGGDRFTVTRHPLPINNPRRLIAAVVARRGGNRIPAFAEQFLPWGASLTPG